MDTNYTNYTTVSGGDSGGSAWSEIPWAIMVSTKLHEQAFVDTTKLCVEQARDALDIFQCIAWPIGVVCIFLTLVFGLMVAFGFCVRACHLKRRRALQGRTASTSTTMVDIDDVVVVPKRSTLLTPTPAAQPYNNVQQVLVRKTRAALNSSTYTNPAVVEDEAVPDHIPQPPPLGAVAVLPADVVFHRSQDD
ncbi:protein ORF108 [Cyprinid herpesvirus 3]|nr:protein ORF108 [Cyprinid herpesvirus 3]